MHMHCSRSASRVAWLLFLTPRSQARPGSGSFRSSVRCKGGQRSRSRHSCPWTWGPGAWCTRWLEGGGGPGPQRRTRRNFVWNSEMAGRSHSLSCWAPGGQAVLKPAREKVLLWVSWPLPHPPFPTPLYRPPHGKGWSRPRAFCTQRHWLCSFHVILLLNFNFVSMGCGFGDLMLVFNVLSSISTSLATYFLVLAIFKLFPF